MNYIDLGLPSGTLWADMNVGATKPEEYGDYFNWKDAQKQGNLPARWQMCELVNECKHKITKVNGVNGMKFTGTNGNSIFLPFAGWLRSGGGSLGNVGYNGSWWSCSCAPSGFHAYILYLNNKGNVRPSDYDHRAFGFSVRLVK